MMKITDEQALEIIYQYDVGHSIKDIASASSLSYHSVYRIVTGKTFKHLHDSKTRSIRNTKADEVVELVKSGYSVSAVAKQMNLSATAVSKIFQRFEGESISDFRKRKSVKYGQDVK